MPDVLSDFHRTINARRREYWWPATVSLGAKDPNGGRQPTDSLASAIEALALDSVFEMTTKDLVEIIVAPAFPMQTTAQAGARLAQVASDAGTDPRTVLMCHVATALLPPPMADVIDLPSEEASHE